MRQLLVTIFKIPEITSVINITQSLGGLRTVLFFFRWDFIK